MGVPLEYCELCEYRDESAWRAATVIDTADLRSRVDLLTLIGRDTRLRRVSSTGGGEYAGPCPSCGGRDRFRVQPERGMWWCRQCSPDERWQDAIEYVRRRDGVGFQEACATLGGDASPTTWNTATSAGSLHMPPPRAPSRDFIGAAIQVLLEGIRVFKEEAHEAPHAYLASERGLTPDTILESHLGIVPAKGQPHGLWVPAGILIPWFSPDMRLQQVKVRLMDSSDQKYTSLAWADKERRRSDGGHPLMYGGNLFQDRDVLVLVEGEFDCMLLRQEAGDLVDVATFGSASKPIGETWEFLAPYSRILVAYDNDEEGEKGAARLLSESDRFCQLRVPEGNDVTEFWKADGDLRQWIAAAGLP